MAAAGDEQQAEAFGFVEVNGFQEIILDAVVLEPLGAADKDGFAINVGFDAATGGFAEIFGFGKGHAGFFGELRQGLGGGVVAVFLGGGGGAEQFDRSGGTERRETADGEFAGG